MAVKVEGHYASGVGELFPNPELPPNIVPVENLHASDFPGDNVEDNHPLVRCQSYIPMTRSIGTLRLGLRVKRATEVVAAAAPVQNRQFRDLCSQLGFALHGQELPKLGRERREGVGEERSFFSLYGHWMFSRVHNAFLYRDA
jgi:hypothetical protein